MSITSLSPSEILLLWAAGVFVALCLVVGAFDAGMPASRAGINDLARQSLVYRGRDIKIAADYAAYARAHPGDSAAQAESRRRDAALARTLHNDSILARIVPPGTLDTAYHPEYHTPRAGFMRLVAAWGTLVMIASAAAIPLLLAGVTVWWAFARRPAQA